MSRFITIVLSFILSLVAQAEAPQDISLAQVREGLNSLYERVAANVKPGVDDDITFVSGVTSTSIKRSKLLNILKSFIEGLDSQTSSSPVERAKARRQFADDLEKSGVVMVVLEGLTRSLPDYYAEPKVCISMFADMVVPRYGKAPQNETGQNKVHCPTLMRRILTKAEEIEKRSLQDQVTPLPTKLGSDQHSPTARPETGFDKKLIDGKSYRCLARRAFSSEVLNSYQFNSSNPLCASLNLYELNCVQHGAEMLSIINKDESLNVYSIDFDINDIRARRFMENCKIPIKEGIATYDLRDVLASFAREAKVDPSTLAIPYKRKTIDFASAETIRTSVLDMAKEFAIFCRTYPYIDESPGCRAFGAFVERIDNPGIKIPGSPSCLLRTFTGGALALTTRETRVYADSPNPAPGFFLRFENLKNQTRTCVFEKSVRKPSSVYQHPSSSTR